MFAHKSCFGSSPMFRIGGSAVVLTSCVLFGAPLVVNLTVGGGGASGEYRMFF